MCFDAAMAASRNLNGRHPSALIKGRQGRGLRGEHPHSHFKSQTCTMDGDPQGQSVLVTSSHHLFLSCRRPCSEWYHACLNMKDPCEAVRMARTRGGSADRMVSEDKIMLLCAEARPTCRVVVLPT